jgi:hypothetical protein
MTARAPVRAHPDPRTGRSAMPKMSKKMPKKKKESRGEAGPTDEIDIDDALADLTLAQRQELVELAKCV